MSSNYHLICLSHDPGIVLPRDMRYEEANGLNTRAAMPGHEHCDVVIGRWSGGMCEVACLGRQIGGPTACKAYHSAAEWTAVDWLRLLAVATTAPNTVPDRVLSPLIRCWPLDRLDRLREELGLPEMVAPLDLARCCCRTHGDQGWRCTLPSAHGGEHRSVQPDGTSYWQDLPTGMEETP